MTDVAVHEPTARQYWMIAAILAVVTAVEIAIPSIEAFEPVKVPALLTLGAIKFGIVVAFFMHLKFEKPLMKGLFLVGALGAIPLFVVVLLTFRAL